MCPPVVNCHAPSYVDLSHVPCDNLHAPSVMTCRMPAEMICHAPKSAGRCETVVPLMFQYSPRYMGEGAVSCVSGKTGLTRSAHAFAGTDIDATPTYPAAYTNGNIMTVIATDENDQLANYSNYGLHNTDIAAPGSKILSTVLNGQV